MNRHVIYRALRYICLVNTFSNWKFRIRQHNTYVSFFLTSVQIFRVVEWLKWKISLKIKNVMFLFLLAGVWGGLWIVSEIQHIFLIIKSEDILILKCFPQIDGQIEYLNTPGLVKETCVIRKKFLRTVNLHIYFF